MPDADGIQVIIYIPALFAQFPVPYRAEMGAALAEAFMWLIAL